MTRLLPLLLSLAIAQISGSPSAGDTQAGGEIRGRITDRDTERPMPRAIVTLWFGRKDVPPWHARADEDGRYRFQALPAGEYALLVQLPEFRATHQMESFPPRGGTIALKEGEVRSDVNVALARTRAIVVRVIDEWSEPLSGVGVTIKSLETGHERGAYGFRLTDDRGRIRLYGLSPGRYVVCADVQQMTSFSPGNAAARDRFLRTCHPSAATDGEAEPVRVDRADVEGVTIVMRRGRTFTVSGALLDASGAPASNARLNLSVFTQNGSSSRGIMVDGGGGFRIANVPPGEYALEAEIGGPNRPEHRRDLEAAFEPIRVDSSDLTGVIVAMTKGITVAGRIRLEKPEVPFPALQGSGLMVQALLANHRLPGSAGSRIAHADERRVFSLDRMVGPRTLEVYNVPRGWYVKSIKYRNEEIIDAATEFKAGTDPGALDILLSARGAMVAGRVLDDRGEPVSSARVLVISADPSKWRTYSRLTATASATGTFRIGPQRAGDYLVLAVGPSAQLPKAGNPDALAPLAVDAQRITLLEDEERTVDVRVIKPR